jgi:hypothetical protein
MAPLPSFPTDSLYKFIALFGLVLLGFGIWYPEQKFYAAQAQMREALTAEDLSRIKVERKKAQVDKLTKKILEKSTELAQKQKLLDDQHKEFESRRLAIEEELARVEKSQRSSSAKELEKRAESLVSEQKSFGAKVQGHLDDVKRLTEERNALTPRQEEVLDELASETVISKKSTKALEDFNSQATSWLYMQNCSIGLGLILITLGFLLWYIRIQKYQDAILRRQAAAESSKV